MTARGATLNPRRVHAVFVKGDDPPRCAANTREYAR